MKKFMALLVLTLPAQDILSTSVAKSDSVICRKINQKDKRMSVVSSRTSGQVLLRFISVKAGSASITVLNEAGKIVLQQQNAISDGINTISIINLLTLKEGLYTVNLTSQKDTYSSGFLFWK